MAARHSIRLALQLGIIEEDLHIAEGASASTIDASQGVPAQLPRDERCHALKLCMALSLNDNEVRAEWKCIYKQASSVLGP